MPIATLNQPGYNTCEAGAHGIVVIGVDGTAADLEAIRSGCMTGTVKQDAHALGKAAVRIALNRLRTGGKGLESDFPLAGDGYSIRIPFVRIDAAHWRENMG